VARDVSKNPLSPLTRDFEKLLMLSTTDVESDYFISVSNRQKTSGVRSVSFIS
jgi:hypothetical protein